MTADRTAPRARRARIRTMLLVLALSLTVLAGASVRGAVTPTEAGFVSVEQATLSATAATMGSPQTTCTPVSGEPNQLAFSPSGDVPAVTEYRITITVDPEPSGGYSWQTGTVGGVELLPIGESSWPATQTLVGWGIELPTLAGDDFYGDVQIVAIGPGGWESAPVTYDWSIEADWGFTTVSCDQVS